MALIIYHQKRLVEQADDELQEENRHMPPYR